MFTSLATTRPLFDFGTALDQVFDGVNGYAPDDVESPGAFQPPVNIGEDADGYFVEMDLPGLSMEELDVTVDGRELTISGERKATSCEGVTYRRRESLVGRFERAFNLPESAETSKVEASLASGVLTVRIPKAETAKPRRIEVKTK